MSAPAEPTEQPLHPTPMNHPMMKGKMTVDVSNKPTFQVCAVQMFIVVGSNGSRSARWLR